MKFVFPNQSFVELKSETQDWNYALFGNHFELNNLKWNSVEPKKYVLLNILEFTKSQFQIQICL